MVSGFYLMMHRRGCTVEMKIHYLHVSLLHNHLRPIQNMWCFLNRKWKNNTTTQRVKSENVLSADKKIISTKGYKLYSKYYINLPMLNSIERANCIDLHEFPPSLVENRFTWLTRPLRLLQASRCWPLGRSSPPWLPHEHLLFCHLRHLARNEPILTRVVHATTDWPHLRENKSLTCLNWLNPCFVGENHGTTYVKFKYHLKSWTIPQIRKPF